MGFQLLISEGKEAGKELVFEQSSVLIGRNSECDVVLYDPGISRKHACIYQEGDCYYVEDMGSANGTKVNGNAVKKQRLSDGDALALGPVVFNFSKLEAGDPATDPNLSAPDGQATRILAAREVKRAALLAPAESGPEDLDELARLKTSVRNSQGRAVRPPLPRRSFASVRQAGVPLTAAERARIRRHSSPPVAAFRVFWAEASVRTKKRLIASAIALGALLFAFALYRIVAGAEGTRAPPEPSVLTRKPIAESFGLGEGVTYRRPDMKIFELELNAAVKAVVILHFQSRDISEGEVKVSVNGADVGVVPADTLASNDRSHEIIVPSQHLRKGEKNHVTFDSTPNPPGADPWRIWNVWVEPNFLPDAPPDELLRSAQVTFDRAQQTLERRNVGADNLYKSWKDFRTAWLTLEAYPDPKPELYLLARDKMKEAQGELDRQCRKLLLEAEGLYQLNQLDKAKAALDQVRAYFPAGDHPCPWRAEQRRAEYGI